MNGGGGDFPFSDIFDFFAAATGGGAGQRGPTPRSRRGQDALLRVTVTLEEATFGVTKDIEVDTAVVCQTCHGTCSAPGTGPRTCDVCGGRGSVQRVDRSFLGPDMTSLACDVLQGCGLEYHTTHRVCIRK